MSQTQNVKRKTQNIPSKSSPKTSSSSKTEPSSMEELLAQTGYEPRGLKKGQQVTGTITALSTKEILIDIAGKTEGIVLEKDRKLYNELLSTLKVGASVTAVVLSPESENGHAVLSLRKTLMDKTWRQLEEKKEKEQEIEVRGADITRGGLLVDVIGLRGFIPLSHLDPKIIGKTESLLNTYFKARILDLDRKERRIVLSQKGARGDGTKIRALFAKLAIGKEYAGTVSGITSFGIFVKIPVRSEPASPDTSQGGPASPEGDGGGEVEGLVHISEISWEKVDDVSRLFTLGDRVTVLVIDIDKENLKLNLSLKKLTQDPWEQIAQKYAKEQSVSGTISKLSSFGVFVALSEGIEGLIHKSKISQGAEFKIGDKIACVVESVDAAKRRIALVPLLKEKPMGYR